jgi:hypothetical protein
MEKRKYCPCWESNSGLPSRSLVVIPRHYRLNMHTRRKNPEEGMSYGPWGKRKSGRPVRRWFKQRRGQRSWNMLLKSSSKLVIMWMAIWRHSGTKLVWWPSERSNYKVLDVMHLNLNSCTVSHFLSWSLPNTVTVDLPQTCFQFHMNGRNSARLVYDFL